MICWALIPIKSTEKGKSRLADALDRDAREALVSGMLAHVVKAATNARTISHVCLVGPSRHGLSDDIDLLPDPGKGLNPAVKSALAQIAEQGPDRIIIVAADLPTVTPQELDLMAVAPIDAIAIAPDRHGTGTNALSLPLPAARDFTFGFGIDSYAHHKHEAQNLGLRVETIISQGLEKDIDEPADLPDAGGMLENRD
ncbi:MAG: 2-phospho-L-lactate guanylyltransferase [Novosphingobium sp.]|nr:2-phospho-L-lactate guanylyltransferase [Novosphingobium sp.]